MAGIPISKLEENTTLSDSSMFAEAESSPASTKKVTFATLFSAIWNKIKGKRVKTYDEIMATTDDEFWASATGIKDGFTQLNTKFVTETTAIKIGTLSPGGTNGEKALSKAEYTPIAVVGFKTNNNTIGVCDMFINGSNLEYRIRNMGSAAANNVYVTVSVMYKKN